MRQPYVNQVELLLRCLPQVEKEDCFAIKGGTALNLFVLDMPRLSVDIDLTYLPVAQRDESLMAIADAMHRVKAGIENTIPKTQIQVASSKEIPVTRLIVHRGDAHR